MLNDWIVQYADIDWSEARSAHFGCRRLVQRIRGDKKLLSALIYGLEGDEERFRRCEMHPLMYRLVLHEDLDRQYQIRMHVVSHEARDLVPHDHKYTFSACILAGGYLHVWNRRTGPQNGGFASADLTPGVVAIERPGAIYTLRNSMVHQTVMTPGTVTLFIRGPRRQSRWHAASDMVSLAADLAVTESGTTQDGSRRLSPDEYRAVCSQLVTQQLIHPTRSLDA